MKLAFFDDYKLGVLEGSSVFDVTDAIRDIRICSPQEQMNRVIADYAKVQSKIQSARQNILVQVLPSRHIRRASPTLNMNKQAKPTMPS